MLLADVGIPDGGGSPHAVSYAYDADGVRKSKSSGGVFTEYLTDKNRPFAQVLEERDGDTDALLVGYTYGDDLISQTRGAATSYYRLAGSGEWFSQVICNHMLILTQTVKRLVVANGLRNLEPDPVALCPPGRAMAGRSRSDQQTSFILMGNR